MKSSNHDTKSTAEQLHEQYDLLRTAYITLLNDKDVLLDWGKPQLEALYMTRIGYLQIEVLQSQLRIKALRRKMELIRACINQDKKIQVNEIELEVAAELADAELKIMHQVMQYENAKGLLANLDSPQRSSDLRKLYKQLAKQLHPDVNSDLTSEQVKLWHLVKEAYEACDLEKLKALQLVYEKELKAVGSKLADLTADEISLKIEVLKEGIKVLNQQLADIRNEFPFTIEVQIKDEEWVNGQTKALMEELDKLKQYEEELTMQYLQIISVL